jgi:hypothetical protein
MMGDYLARSTGGIRPYITTMFRRAAIRTNGIDYPPHGLLRETWRG